MPDDLAMQMAVLDHLAQTAPHLPVPRALPGPGRHAGDCQPRSAASAPRACSPGCRATSGRTPRCAAGRALTTLGRLLGELDRSLEGFAHGARSAPMPGYRPRRHASGKSPVHRRCAKKQVADPGHSERSSPSVCRRLEKLPASGHPSTTPTTITSLSWIADGQVGGLLDFGDMVEPCASSRSPSPAPMR